MGTRSKGRQGVFVNFLGTRQKRLCDNGAFGQSDSQKVLNHNRRVRETADKETT